MILLTVPALTALGALADKLLGGGGLQMETAERFVQQPWSFLPFAVFTLVFGPLPEEMAWRGYALDGLQIQWKALTASIALGAAWTVWHLPLFFIEGSYQHGLGLPVAGQRMSRDRTFFGSYSAYQYPVPRQMGHGRPPRVTP